MNRLPRAVRLVALSASMAVSLMYAAQPTWAAAAGRSGRTPPAGSRSGAGSSGGMTSGGTRAGAGTRTPARAAQPAPAAADAPADNAAAPAPTAPDAAAPAATDNAAAPAPAAPAPGADATAAAPAPDAAADAAKAPLAEQVQNFIHYARIHNYQMANIAGNAILNSGGDPREVTQMFEAAARERRLNLDEWLTRQQGINELRDVSMKLRQMLGKGYLSRASDVQFIKQNIERLGGTARGQELAVEQLRNSGELAAAIMLQYLTDPAQQRLHFNIRQALISMGRTALAPLTAATEMRNNPDALITVLTVLGNLGYQDAAPYLAKVANDNGVPPALRQIAQENLQRLGGNSGQGGGGANVAQMFYELAERFYYNQTAFRPETHGGPTANVWQWNGNTLASRAVPAQVYDETMAMRAAEEAMRTGNLGGGPVSLWLAADFRKEIEAPNAAEAGQPGAHYFAVSAGTPYVNEVLARSLKDGNAKVALRAIQALQSIVGPGNMNAGNNEGGQQPLLAALGYRGDRSVRLAAAMALAEAMPRQPFEGSDRVVPLLAEAMSQTGKPNVLVVAGSDAERNRLANELKQYNVVGGVGAQNALAQAQSLPSVDVVVVARDVRASDIDQLMGMANEDMRVGGAAKVILQSGRGGPWAQRALTDATVSVSTANDAAGGLAQAIDQGRQRAGGGGAMDAESMNQSALRAAQLLRDLAISHNEVLNVAAAEQPLLATLNDPRPEIVKAAGEILALIQSPRAQSALAAVALDDKTPEELKVSLLHSVATSAKTWGNRLDQGAVGALQQAAMSAQNLQVRSAAADALGALALPNQQAKQLILQASQQMQQQAAPPAAAAAPAPAAAAQPQQPTAAPAGAAQPAGQ